MITPLAAMSEHVYIIMRGKPTWLVMRVSQISCFDFQDVGPHPWYIEPIVVCCRILDVNSTHKWRHLHCQFISLCSWFFSFMITTMLVWSLNINLFIHSKEMNLVFVKRNIFDHFHLSVNGVCTQHNYCSPDPCQNGATCYPGITSYTCVCVVGYQGDQCQHQIDLCLSSPCKHLGVCVSEVNAYSCICASHTIGRLNK